MRSLGLCLVAPLIAACRLGFDPQPAVPEDAAPDAAPPTLLKCDAQLAFRLAAMPKRVAATAWSGGFVVVTADADGAVRGSTYKFVDGALVADRQDVMLASGMSATATLATLTAGDQTLLVVPHDDGTELIALDAALAPAATPSTHASWIGGAGAIAQNTAGELAFLSANSATNQVAVTLVGRDGAATAAPPFVIAEPGDMASLPSISPAGGDFLVVWDRVETVAASSRRIARAQLLGVEAGKLVARTPAVQTNTDTAIEAENPRGAFLPAHGDFLVAWMKKTNGGELWASLRTSALGPDGADLRLGSPGNFPAVAAATDDFLVAWRSADELFAARLTPAGALTSIPVVTAGGAIAGWDVISRAGQAALVWVEADTGGGAMLKLDPLCHR